MPDKCSSILIVEDDADIRTALVDLLNLEGYNPDTAENGIAALEKLKILDKPCLVLLDLLMPGMDGFTFIAQIRNMGLSGMAHIVIITATSRINLEGFRVIKKPFNTEDLMGTVNSICGHLRKKVSA